MVRLRSRVTAFDSTASALVDRSVLCRVCPTPTLRLISSAAYSAVFILRYGPDAQNVV